MSDIPLVYRVHAETSIRWSLFEACWFF